LVQLSKKLLFITNTAKLIGPVIEKTVAHIKHYTSLQDTCQCHLVVFSKIFYNSLPLMNERISENKADIGPNYFGR